jgi:PAS domain-containing protein
MDATIGAINDGHVYAYVTKPWDQDQLKQVVRRAVEHHRLACENQRLLAEISGANVFLQSVMDQLDTGALAIDATGTVRAANRAARDYLGLGKDPRGETLEGILGDPGLAPLASCTVRLAAESTGGGGAGAGSEEIELTRHGKKHRLRVQVQTLADDRGAPLGRVVLAREVSHEPLRRRFEEQVENLFETDAPRETLRTVQADLRKIAGEAGASNVGSPAMAEVAERASRSATAIDHWLAVDDLLAREDYPDAQLLRERMRVAGSRWPFPDRLPARVAELARRVEAYYESGENTKQPVL